MTSIRPADTPPPTLPGYILVGGKGGVGKTTCAAAIAVSGARRGLRVLAISTDPAPSLGDALGRALGATPRAVPVGRPRALTTAESLRWTAAPDSRHPGTLHAVEIDAKRALQRWLTERRDAFERIASRGTWLDSDDIAGLLRLSLPGIDEIAALLEIVRYGRSGRFDVIVVDTAPTGHTLRLLAMPGTLRRLAEVFDAMQAKHRMVVDALRGGWSPDAEDAVIQELDDEGRKVSELLRDPARVRTSWVTLPEPMAVEETADGLSALAALGMAPAEVIVNRLTPAAGGRCPRCDARRSFEARAVARLRRVAGSAPLVAIAAREAEPRGVRALAALGREWSVARPPAAVKTPRHVAWRAVIVQGTGAPDVPLELCGAGTRLLMFGGKGGVGKTTCAAAASLAIAEADPSRRVLLMSTDPAHSLSDALTPGVSNRESAVPGAPANFLVREIDAAAGFAAIRERYARGIAGVYDRITRGSNVDALHDRRVLTDLFDLAPPGIDELVAVAEVTGALEPDGGQHRQLVVMDMAPSGHALRLLATPEVVHDWTKALMAILLKYQAVVGVGELGSMLLGMSRTLGRLRTLLQDAERTRFVVVTRAAALPRLETGRLLKTLRVMRIPVSSVIVNATGRGSCPRCRREAAAERKETTALARLVRVHGAALVRTPAEVPPPHGARGLRGWSTRWQGGLA